MTSIVQRWNEWRAENPWERIGLRGADLQGADLRGAYLQRAYLQGAYLQDAYLKGAYLRGAYLQRANLRGANLRGAYLRDADLRGADLRDADLRGANLRDANLRDADLRGADLRDADLRDADLRGADLSPFQLVSEIGSFSAWKKVRAANGDSAVLELLIPADATRTSSLVGRKCRASAVRVIAAHGSEETEFFSPTHDKKLCYRVGDLVTADNYDPDIRVECAGGIHFFITRKEAEEF